MKTARIALFLALVSATAPAALAQTEALPMPRREGVAAPAVATDGECAPCAKHGGDCRKRFDDWLMFQPLHHPKVCTGYGHQPVPCCDPPLYAFFIGICPVAQPSSERSHVGMKLQHVAHGIQESCAQKHPVAALWQRGTGAIKSHCANAMEHMKACSSCPHCGKTIYLALWKRHQCAGPDCHSKLDRISEDATGEPLDGAKADGFPCLGSNRAKDVAAAPAKVEPKDKVLFRMPIASKPAPNTQK